MNSKDIYRKATNLQEVFENFDVNWEIPPDSPYAVQLPKDPLESIRKKLTIAKRNPAKIFFTGHRGAGKTFQVHKLICELVPSDDFLPFYLNISDSFDLINFEYQDVIFGIVASVYETYVGKKLKNRLGLGYNKKKLSKKLIKAFNQWSKNITEETQKKIKGELGIKLDAGLSEYLPKFSAILKFSKDTASKTREVIDIKINELLQIYADTVAEIEKIECKKVFVVIDGLDRVDFNKAKILFKVYLEKLMQPESSLLYVIPVVVPYQVPLVDIEEKICRIDNIPIFSPLGQFEKLDDKSFNLCSEIIFKRMEKESGLISDSALEEVIKLSSGVIKLLILNVQKASEKAMIRNSGVIEKEDVQKVKSDNVYFYRQVLTFSDDFREQDKIKVLEVCKNIKNTPQKKTMEEIIGPLIHNLMVIEYPDEPRQYGIHPAMESLVNEYLEDK